MRRDRQARRGGRRDLVDDEQLGPTGPQARPVIGGDDLVGGAAHRTSTLRAVAPVRAHSRSIAKSIEP